MIDLEKALPYLREHKGKLFVVKVGGECLGTPARVARLASELALVEALGPRLVVVHGAGPQTDALQRAAGEEPEKRGGRRITSPLALLALRHATLGELNPDLTGALGVHGTRAVGVCAATGGILVARRRPPVATPDGPVDFGEVGDVVSVDARPLQALVDAGCVPVLGPPASDGAGGMLNVNADLAAAHLALALGAEKLVLLTGVDGVLLDVDDPMSLASTLHDGELAELARDGALRGGMQVKAEAARLALQGGVPRVHVVSGTRPGALLGELFTVQGTGTLITCEPASQATVVGAAP
jgi:acetylglutamate kinase